MRKAMAEQCLNRGSRGSQEFLKRKEGERQEIISTSCAACILDVAGLKLESGAQTT